METNRSNGKPCILTIGLSPEQLLPLREALAASDTPLLRCATEAEARAVLRDRPAALLVLPLDGAGCGSLSAARRLREPGPTSHPPILLLAGPEVDDRTLEAAEAIPGMDFLSPPLRPSLVRARVSAALERAEHQQAYSILDRITDAFFALDREWRVTYVNRQAGRLLSRNPQDLIGRCLWDEYPAALGTVFHESYQRAMDENVPTTAEAYYPPHDRWYEAHAYPSGDGLSIYFRDVTARWQAEAALRHREEQYRLLFESIDEGFCVIEMMFDAEGRPVDYRFEEINPAFEEHTGLRQAAGKTAREMVPGLEPHWFEIYGRVAVTGEPIRFENRSSPMGDRWFDVYAFRIGGPESRRVALLFTDISERKRTEAALLEAQEFNAFASEAGRTGFWSIDLATGETTISPMMAELLGLPPGQQTIGSQQWRRRIAPQDLPALEEALGQAVDTGTPFAAEFRIAPEGGVERWLYARGGVVRDAAGRPLRLHGATVDLTERKRAEVELRESESRLSAALAVAQLGTFEWNVLTDEVRLDARSREIFGFGPGGAIRAEEVFGRVHPEDLPRVVEEAQRSRRDLARLETEYRIVLPDGTERTIISINDAVAGPDGTAVRMFGVFGDVTERRRMEDDLRSLAADLAEADRRKDEFLATLAHELRNPLAPLRSGLEILNRSQDDPGALERARAMMDRQLGHLVRLVDDLLDVSRITRGKLELRPERVPLSAVVASAVETSKPAIMAGGHRFEVTIPPDPLYLDVDPTRLAQVFANLLNNAAKYTPPGGHIRLAAERLDGEVRVAVQDTGVGIPPAMLPRVFDMFSQAEQSLYRSQGGLGIGLTLVRQLVHLHGGRVEAHSAGPGQGSEFVVSLPVAAGPPCGAGETAPRSAPPVERRLLVVDDSEDAAESLAELLELLGHQVRTAHDGEEAVEAAAAFRPHVVLLDIGLPRMNGYEACRRIRALPGGEEIFIAALTGWGQGEDRRRSSEAGFDLHLVKPIDPGSLEQLAQRRRGDA